MYNGTIIGVVVPAYNEEGFISGVIDSLPEYVDQVFVIDDCSTDGTWTEIKEYVDTEVKQAGVTDDSAGEIVVADGAGTTISESQTFLDKRIVPVRHQTNGGRGAAIQTGYELALMSGMDAIAVLDGDGQMDPNILDEILDPVVEGKADYAKGNRLISRRHCAQMSNWRFFGNALLTILTKIASGHWKMRDPQNGYTAISATALEQLSLNDLFDDYGFLNDMLIQLDANGMTVQDVPMEAFYGDESSGIRYSSFVPKLSLLLVQGYIWRLQQKYLSRTEPE
ncbi:Glycosyl transferase family 2 [Haloarcula vallismortis]|uniref:Dolichyl-phosphate beta-D-mannosyltransferase n=2 Tax=Haloarcula vallismortis TaxID=28442 RepID=M0JPC1_HALVA|nr:glycosyltransferase family 2 protein [Haloarcula vallismortis]EMA09829.1 dolichyl-phosphate beta-D-mannosyltransferase [Haloarcula vallismortis ATCC 29715]SDX05902.1 Glycosyl transferase family 2 [Haloarcula vallismortis]